MAGSRAPPSIMFYQPLRWSYRVCGIASKGTPMDKVWAGFALVTVFAFGLPILLQASAFLKSVYGSLYFTGYVCSFVSMIGIVVYNCCFPAAYHSFEKELQHIEVDLHKIGAPPGRCLPMQVAMFCGELVTLTWLFTYHFVLSHGPVMLVTRLFHQVLVVTPLLQHIVLARVLGQGYAALNVRMSQIAAAVDDTPVPITSAQMEAVFRVHSDLHAVTCDVNTHYCFFHLFNFTSRTFFFVFQMYDFLVYISGFPDRFSAYDVFFYVELLILFVTHAVTCHAAAKQANRTVLIGHRMLTPNTPDRLWQDVGLFSSLSMDNKVRFTAGGVFTIDRTLLTKTSVTALSYLIISIQLRDVELFGGSPRSALAIAGLNDTTTLAAIQ